MYDTISRRFISRGELCEEIERLTFEGFDEYSTAKTPLEATEDEDPSKFVLRWALKDDECHEIKRLVLLYTRYAILSHTWGKDELSYEAVHKAFPESVEASNLSNDDTLTNNPILNGSSKFSGFLRAAKSLGCRYLWLDTACIDKTSSAELDESIRSMFTWYRVAYVCVIYLDTEGLYDCLVARWFKRGWTLQEVLASKRLVFFQSDWKRVFVPHGLETPFVTNNDLSWSQRGDPHTAFTRNNRCFDVVRKFGLAGYDAHEPEIDIDFYDEHCTEDEVANNKAIIDELVEYHLTRPRPDEGRYDCVPPIPKPSQNYIQGRTLLPPKRADSVDFPTNEIRIFPPVTIIIANVDELIALDTILLQDAFSSLAGSKCGLYTLVPTVEWISFLPERW
ncbi:hypothetical protein ONZ45_g3431 [Pleurotus djamor]|nr:hypothetical protein ONZ45_g3431 [Pleurotus djamor]